MKFKNPPYLFAIDDHDVTIRNWHALIADRLTAGGFDVGPMAWVAAANSFSRLEIRIHWQDAFKRAGIARMDTGHDTAKGRTWFKVWRKEEA